MMSYVPSDVLDNIDLTVKPRYISTDIEESDMIYWNSAEHFLYPLKADQSFDIEYDIKNSNCDNAKLILRVHTQWPEFPHITHVANTPPLEIDPVVDDDVAFIDIHSVEADATVTGKKFTASQKGRSVVHFKRNYIENTVPKEISLNFDGQSHVVTEPITADQKFFTISFYARRSRNSSYQVIIGQGEDNYGKGLTIGFDENDKFMFNIEGNPLKTEQSYTDNQWHHWTCTSAFLRVTGATFRCENYSYNYQCKFWNNYCYTVGKTGGYCYPNHPRYRQLTNLTKWQKNRPVYLYDFYLFRECRDDLQYQRRIYCDGELVAEHIVDTPYKGYGNIYIGKSPWDDYSGFEGQVDDIKILSSPLTQPQIADSIDKPFTEVSSKTIAYFPMDRIGSSFLIGERGDSSKKRIAILKNFDPSNDWIVDTDKPYVLKPTNIPVSGKSCIRVVETRMESENTLSVNAIVGYEINGVAFHDQRTSHNGYVFFDKTPYNADIYSRETLQGPIYPVNIRHPGKDARDSILVIWYRVQDGASWPYQPVEYQNEWPDRSDSRIVIASRLGSEGKSPQFEDQTYPDMNGDPKNYFDPARYSDLKIYNQPNPDLAGYNPNEEHAMVTSSFRHSSASPLPTGSLCP